MDKADFFFVGVVQIEIFPKPVFGILLTTWDSLLGMLGTYKQQDGIHSKVVRVVEQNEIKKSDKFG